MRKVLSAILSLALAVSFAVPAAKASYTDVPANDVLAVEVEKATEKPPNEGIWSQNSYF